MTATPKTPPQSPRVAENDSERLVMLAREFGDVMRCSVESDDDGCVTIDYIPMARWIDNRMRILRETLERASKLAEDLGDAAPEHEWSDSECEMLGELRQVLIDALEPSP